MIMILDFSCFILTHLSQLIRKCEGVSNFFTHSSHVFQVVSAQFNGKPVSQHQMAPQRSEYHTEIADNRSQQGITTSQSTEDRVPGAGGSGHQGNTSIQSVAASDSATDMKSQQTSTNLPHITTDQARFLVDSKSQQMTAGVSQATAPQDRAKLDFRSQTTTAFNQATVAHGRVPADGKSEKKPLDSKKTMVHKSSSKSRSNGDRDSTSKHSTLTSGTISNSSSKHRHSSDSVASSRDSQSTLTHSSVNTSESRDTNERSQGRGEGASSSDNDSNQSDTKGEVNVSAVNGEIRKERPKQSNIDLGGAKKNMNNAQTKSKKSKTKRDHQSKKVSTFQNNVTSGMGCPSTPVVTGPTTPKHLKLREKDFRSVTPVDEMGPESRSNIVWKSPRPSSALTRSRCDNSFDYSESMSRLDFSRPLEPDGGSSVTTSVVAQPIAIQNKQTELLSERQVPGTEEGGDFSATPDRVGFKKDRSSTPMADDHMTLTLGTQDNFSHIVALSPSRIVDEDSSESTLTENDKASPSSSTGVAPAHTSLSPKQSPQQTPTLLTNQPAAPSQPSHQVRLAPPASLQTRMAPPPTLLTNQPLSKTPFASQYLSQQAGPPYPPTVYRSTSAGHLYAHSSAGLYCEMLNVV